MQYVRSKINRQALTFIYFICVCYKGKAAFPPLFPCTKINLKIIVNFVKADYTPDLFFEITVVQSQESFAVTRFVASHFVDGVVDSVQV